MGGRFHCRNPATSTPTVGPSNPATSKPSTMVLSVMAPSAIERRRIDLPLRLMARRGFRLFGDPIPEVGQIGTELIDRESKAEDALDVVDVQMAQGARLAEPVHGVTKRQRGLVEGLRRGGHGTRTHGGGGRR